MRQTQKRFSVGPALALAGTALALLLALPAAAHAEFEPIGEFGHGTAFRKQQSGDIFTSDILGGIAVNRTSGDLYVVDERQARVDRFDSEGGFISAWGAGVVTGGAAGTGNLTENSTTVSNLVTTHKAFETGQAIEGEGIPAGTEIAEVGSAGTIKLSQPATMTKAADHLTVAEGAGNVATNEMQQIAAPGPAVAAFALAFSTPNPSPTEGASTSIPTSATAGEVQSALEGASNVGAGSVSVSGSPGGPWSVEFTGTRFADTDVEQLAASGETVAYPVGAQLSCTSATTATTTNYQWLRDGAPILGATAATYTTEAADAGEELQCQVTKLNSNAGSTGVSGPVPVGSVPSPLPPTPFNPGFVNGTVAAGQTLTCEQGTWHNSPTAYAFQWYRNGVPVPGATSSTYLLTAPDVASPAVFQCVVTASNAGGSTAQADQNRPTSPAPSPEAPGGNGGYPAVTVPALGLATETTRVGASAPETCTVLAQCKAGDKEAADGKFLALSGVAVDPQSEDVYVLDSSVSRSEGLIQKFTPSGAFLSAFGQRGNASPEQIQEPLRSGGQLEGSPNGIAVGPGGKVYVVDRGSAFGPRIAVFSSSGTYLESLGASLFTPEIGPTGVAVDDAGEVYVSSVKYIFKLASSGQLAWKHEDSSNAIKGMAVNPATGESFYFRRASTEGIVVQLGDAGEQVGEFVAQPEERRSTEKALAFDPDVTPAGPPARPEGVLYGIDSQNERGLVFAQSPVAPPQVKSEFAASVLETTATIKATINQKGAKATYRFEYGAEGPCSIDPCAEAPAGGAGLASSKEDRAVAATLSGLVPGTAYHYRVLVSNASGVTEGEDETFTTFPATPAGLPDGRAWELVSPALKNGGNAYPPHTNIGSCVPTCTFHEGVHQAIQVAGDGGAVAYQGQPFTDSVATGENEYLSSRSPSGWQTSGLTAVDLSEGRFELFSPDFSRGILYLSQGEWQAPAPPGYHNLYLRRSGGSLDPLVSMRPPNRPPEGFGISLEGANAGTASTAALSHVIFAANDALTVATTSAPPAPDPGATNLDLYEWFEGQLRLVNVLPGNSTVATGPNVNFGAGGNPIEAAVDHAITDDGSRVYWSDSSGQLFVRIDSTETRKVEDPGSFLTASADGSRVLLDDGCLYSLAGEACEDLTQGLGRFEGMLGASESLSRIYFVDKATLTPPGEKNANGESAEADKDNLYAWHEGTLSFIGALVAGDKLPSLGVGAAGGDWWPQQNRRPVDVSPDGRYLAFTSQARLTGYDNYGPTCNYESFIQPEHFEPGDCYEVYLYDAASGKLTCGSCNPTGRAPLGNSLLGVVPNETGPLSDFRNLSAGGRLFFESQDVLSPRDTNGKTQDVYEWEPQRGSESPEGDSCERAEGCLSLISNGHGDQDSYFLDATPSGRDVFFVTRDRLVPEDPDQLLDVYDARIGGGVEPQTSSECQGEACQAPVSPPNDATPASSSFEGSGNVVEAKKSKKAKKHRRHRHRARHRRHARTANHHHGGAK